MKKITTLLFTAFLLFGLSGNLMGQIIAFDTDGLSGNEATFDATTLNANLQTVTLSRGAGLSGTSLADSYYSTGFSSTGTRNAAINENDYLEFSITPNSGYKFSLSTLDVNFRRTSTGPNKFQWQYSLDDFATSGVDISAEISYTNDGGDGDAQTQIDLSGISALQDVEGETITIRLYGWGSTGGNFGIGKLSGDDLAIDGSVVATASEVPPSIDDVSISNISVTTATYSSEVLNDGGASVTERGFVYSKTTDNSDPIIDDTNVTKVTSGSGTGAFTEDITGLTGNTEYSVKSYATNTEGTTYSGVVNFTTLGIVNLSGIYEQDFSSFTSVETLPTGWTIDESYDYRGAFTSSTTTSGLYGEGALGFQILTSGSLSNVSATLKLKNETGSTIEALSISYEGLVERLSATRLPEWTVKIDENEVSDLSYRTELGEDQTKHIIVSGLNIANDAEFEIQWSSSNDESNSGSNRKIGIANVSIEAIEHYVDLTGGEGWRILSSPTSDNTYDDLLAPLWTQGITTGANITEGVTNVQTFENDTDSFSGIDDMGTAMSPGIGFITYVYADVDYDGTDESFPKTIGLNGTENTGSVSPTLNSGTDAWTLVGNPYYSGISWDNVLSNTGTANITSTVYVYDHSYGTFSEPDAEATESAGSYRTWNGEAGSLTDGRISSFQGFWVQNASSGTPSLSFEEDDQISTDTTFFKQRNSNKEIAIKLRGEMKNMYSESFLSFTENGEVAKDNFDGLKLSPLDFRPYLSVATLTGDTKLDINNLPRSFDNDLTIPVSVEAFTADSESGSWISRGGQVTLSWPQMKNLPDGWSITLNDSKTGATIDMRTAEQYVFDLAGTQQAKAGPVMTILNPQPPQVERLAKSAEGVRFTVTISANSSVSTEPGDTPQGFALEQNYPNPFNPTTSIQYSVAEAGPVSLTIYNVMGQQVETLVSETKSAGSYRVSWNAANMASGIYYYRLQAGSQVLTRQMTLIK